MEGEGSQCMGGGLVSRGLTGLGSWGRWWRFDWDLSCVIKLDIVYYGTALTLHSAV